MSNDKRGIHERVARTPEALSQMEELEDDESQSGYARILELQRARKIIYFLTNAAAMVIFLRFLLLAVGASHDNFFATLILALSYPLTLPFEGLFGEPLKLGPSNQYVFDFSYLFAIGMYYLLALGVVKLVTLYYTRYSVTG